MFWSIFVWESAPVGDFTLGVMLEAVRSLLSDELEMQPSDERYAKCFVIVNMLMKAFVGIIAILIVVFAVLMVGLATDMFPLNIGNTKISGIEGMALGTIALIFTFGLLSVVVLIMMAIIYGLGFVLVGLAVGVPLLILASIFPVLVH